MNFLNIEYFLITAEEMNFTRAAERLYISQQALSSHIKRLEEEYGVQLFERKPTLHLTPEGRQMLFYGRKILEAEKKMQAAFSDINENCRAILRVGCSRLRISTFFPQIWRYYHENHPNIFIELVDEGSKKLEGLLQDGKIDLYIGMDAPTDTNQERIELAREKLYCCVSRSLLAGIHREDWEAILHQYKGGIHLEELSCFPIITMRQGNRQRDVLDRVLAQKSFQLKFAIECNQQDMIYMLAKEGYGIGILSQVILYQYLNEREKLQDELYVFPLADPLPQNVVSCVYRKDYPLPRHAMDFVQIVCMVFRRYAHIMGTI